MSEPQLLQKKILGFLGTGNMAYAIAKGIIISKLLPASNIYGSDPNEESRSRFQSLSSSLNVLENNQILVEKTDLIILAVKPQTALELLTKLDKSALQNKLFISIMAGITCTWLEKQLGNLPGIRIVRVMPNTPLMALEGASVIFTNQFCKNSDFELVSAIFSCAGIVERVNDEGLLDAVTAVSGSGPAYIFRMIEAMTEGGVKAGLSKELSQKLAIQTVLGSGKLAKTSEKSPTELREMVTSKGGTTDAALKIFEKFNFLDIVSEAVVAAHERSRQLAAAL